MTITWPLVLNAPTGGAVLGTTTTTVLRIHDVDPDFTPPQVTGLQWYGSATAITSIVLSFSEPLQATSASNPANYQLSGPGDERTGKPVQQPRTRIHFPRLQSA